MDTKEICRRITCLTLTVFSIFLLVGIVFEDDSSIQYNSEPPMQKTIIPIPRPDGQDFEENAEEDSSIEGDTSEDAVFDLQEEDLADEAILTTSILDVSNYTLQTPETAVTVLSKMVWGEARGLSKKHQAACVWVALNRVDSGYSDSIVDVVTARSQFTGYRSSNPVTDEIKELVEDVLARWELEHAGEENVGRVLPKEYLWFHGDGVTNHFRDKFSGSFNRWDWSLPSPYGD